MTGKEIQGKFPGQELLQTLIFALIRGNLDFWVSI
jgi:hypothetical protein